MRAGVGAGPRTPASCFTRDLGERRAIRPWGGGTQAHINPLPPGCNHHQNAHHARSNSIKHIFLKSPGPSQHLYACFGQMTSDPTRGRGDTGTHKSLPPGCNHHRNAHLARFNIIKHPLKSHACHGSPATPPLHARHVIPCPRFSAV
jgi:hypothetical protein